MSAAAARIAELEQRVATLEAERAPSSAPAPAAGSEVDWSAPADPNAPPAPPETVLARMQRIYVLPLENQLARQQGEVDALEKSRADWTEQERDPTEWHLQQMRDHVAATRTRLDRVRKLDLEQCAARLAAGDELADPATLAARVEGTVEKFYQASLLRLDVFNEMKAHREGLEADLRDLCDLKAQLDGYEKAPNYFGVVRRVDVAFSIAEPVRARIEAHLGLGNGGTITGRSDPRLAALEFAFGEKA